MFILYTSGSTGKPKGILHSTGGYLLGTWLTARYVLDLREDDIYWCTADTGWVTGHSYVVYGPLANGATVLMYEGVLNFPDWGRFWQIVEKHRVTIFYTTPAAIRAFIKAGDHFAGKHDLRSLRLLGTVGEPINPEAWMWYHEVIGQGRCPVVDTWWQTETGAIMIAPLPGATPAKPGSATLPFFGVDAAILDEAGRECLPNQGGRLVIRKPWPSMARTLWGDDARFQQVYWSEYEDIYLTGDVALRDEDGYFWIAGRLDDVLNVPGLLLHTAEVESALLSHPAVAEAAVVADPDAARGPGVLAFVTLKQGVAASAELRSELRAQVTGDVAATARLDDIVLAQGLPKTKSGKIMRCLLKELAETGEISGNVTTVEDMGVIETLKAQLKSRSAGT